MSSNIPKHVAIVMDGNGRWAESKGLARIEGHRVGLESVKAVIECCLEKKIACLSLFAFSSENWSRPTDEVDFLMQLFLEALKQEIDELHAHGIKIKFTGARDQLNAKLCEQMAEAEVRTMHNSKLTLNILVNYGGKWDITQAAKRLAEDVSKEVVRSDEVSESLFSRYLSTADLPDPDLLIRSSGEVRLSNFFLWQAAYTELYFTEVYWPDFRKEAFDSALAAYAQRQRRYGRLNEQTTRQ